MEESTVKSRLLEYLRHKRISQTEFTKNLGVSSTYIGAMRKGIPADKLKKISELYPDLNRDWLLYGDGSMIADPSRSNTENNAPAGFETLLLPVSACAGSLQMYSSGVMRGDCQRIISPIPDADFAIPVRGDSMEPLFHDGSTILIRKINDKSFIPWGHPMVIDTENGVLIKKVLPYRNKENEYDDEYVVVESQNPKYPPFRIPTSSIYGLYRVLGCFEVFPTL